MLSATLWCFVGAGVLVLLLAAIRYRNNNTCKGYRIVISAPAGVFIDKKQIAALLIPGRNWCRGRIRRQIGSRSHTG